MFQKIPSVRISTIHKEHCLGKSKKTKEKKNKISNPSKASHPFRRFAFKFTGAVVALVILPTAIAVLWAGDPLYKGHLDEQLVYDVTRLNPTPVSGVFRPKTVAELTEFVRKTPGPLAIGGGRFSMGGQTAIPGRPQIDMRALDKIVAFHPAEKEITVEAGITWRKIQEAIDPSNLSVRIMQTYSNFTVGGSLSVNAHGRYIGFGPLALSVKSLKVVLGDGRVVPASATQNRDLFYGVLGGYGGLGVIVEATLALADNVKIERRTERVAIDSYPKHFFESIRDRKDVIFHNADIFPPAYENVRDVSWFVTDRPTTTAARLIPEHEPYWWQPRFIEWLGGNRFGKWLREYCLEPIYYAQDRVVYRNWEASYDVAELEPSSRDHETYVLREYFVPVGRFQDFVPKMREIFQRYNVNVLNVSIRHAFQDPGTVMAWAREEVFAFVVYYRQGTSPEAQEEVGNWSREMIDAAVSVGGTYYLPYQNHATLEQFYKAYPRAKEFLALKKKWDPSRKFSNSLWEKYAPPQETAISQAEKNLKHVRRGEEQTYLTIPEWYLVFQPKEYADALATGRNPSDFPYLASIDEYWSLYDRVTQLTRNVYPRNSEYLTMLRVIGVSATYEFLVKGVYENTIGRFTRWLTGGLDTDEDRLMARAHRAYSDLIYDKAWYEFEFWPWVGRMWSETSFFGPNLIRKTERKLFFTLEFGVKTLYARLIGWGAKTAYEASEGLVYLKVRAPGGRSIERITRNVPGVTVLATEGAVSLISVPRWGPFTQILPKLAELDLEFVDISGNDDIAVTVLVPQGTPHPSGRLLFSSRVLSDPRTTRWAVAVKVGELASFLRQARSQWGGVEHIFDY